MMNRISVSVVEHGKQAQMLGCEEGDCIAECCGERDIRTGEDLKRVVLAANSQEVDIIFYSRTKDSIYKTKLALGSAGMSVKSSAVGDIVESRIQKRLKEYDESLVAVSTDSLGVVDSAPALQEQVTGEGVKEAGSPLIDEGHDEIVQESESRVELNEDVEDPHSSLNDDLVCIHPEDAQETNLQKDAGGDQSPQVENENSSVKGQINPEHEVPIEPVAQTSNLSDEVSRLAMLAEATDEESQVVLEETPGNRQEKNTEDGTEVIIDESEQWPETSDVDELLSGIEGIVSVGEKEQKEIVSSADTIADSKTLLQLPKELEAPADTVDASDYSGVIAFAETKLDELEQDDQDVAVLIEQRTTGSDAEPVIVDENEDPEIAREVQSFLSKTAQASTQASSAFQASDSNIREEQSLKAADVQSVTSSEAIEESDEKAEEIESYFSARAENISSGTDLENRKESFEYQTKLEVIEQGELAGVVQDTSTKAIEIKDAYEIVSQLIYTSQIPMISGPATPNGLLTSQRFLSVVQVTVRGSDISELTLRALQHMEKAALEAGADAVLNMAQQVCALPVIPGSTELDLLINMHGTAVKNF